MCRIQQLKVRAVRVPMTHPHRTAGGVISESPLVLTDVLTDDGIVGHSLVFTYTTAALKPTADLIQNLEPLVVGGAVGTGRGRAEAVGEGSDCSAPKGSSVSRCRRSTWRSGTLWLADRALRWSVCSVVSRSRFPRTGGRRIRRAGGLGEGRG